MLSNYLKIAVRQLLKNKIFSAINIFGLAVGVACCAILALYIQDEFSFEKQYPDHARIYRIYTHFTKDGHTDIFPRTSPPIAIDLAQILPEVENATRMVNPPNVTQHIIKHKDRIFTEKTGFLVDSTFFKIFPSTFKEGDIRTALDKPSTVVLSEKLAGKIFGKNSPLDELLIINSGQASDTFRVTGVLKTPTMPSHLDADFYLSMHSDGWGKYVMGQTTWAWNNFVSGYLLLKPGADLAAIEKKMAKLLNDRAGSDLNAIGLKKELHLQALDDIRLYSDFTDTFGDMGKGTITYIYILGSIGVFILLIACINFMNLTTAKSTQRAGEVGIRKSMGAHRGSLIRQFMGESFTIVFASLVLSIFLIWATLPIVNYIMQKELTINSSNIFFLGAAMLAIALITGILAGSYPAFVLSSYEPARVLKNKNITGDSSSWLRKGLVIFQFVIAITLISSILIIQQQLKFIQSEPLGFRENNIVMIPLRTKDASSQFIYLRDEYKRIPGVQEVSATSSLPSTPLFQDNAFYTEGSSPDKAILTRVIDVDENYYKILEIKLIAGRDFIAETDTFTYNKPKNKVILNEASLRALGIPLETAIGARIFTNGDKKTQQYEIIGVVRDFHQASLHLPIMPLLFKIPSNRKEYAYLTVGVAGENYAPTLAAMHKAWDKVLPDVPFESELLSDSIKKQYESDDRISIMLTWSTVLAIVISCLGLYGLSIFVAERKIKEIGIRKVLGASVPGIVTMLSKEFIILVGVAFIIAVPIGYYTMQKWLNGFAYKIELGFLVFVLSGVASLLIAWVTIGFESIKAATGNPINALRNE
jgi:putative ABC transport system permease protein